MAKARKQNGGESKKRGRIHSGRRNTIEFRFYASHGELTTAFLREFPQTRRAARDSTIKGAFDRNGVLHLNDGGSIHGLPALSTEFHAHEITHSIDGNGHEISGSKEWKAAWEKDKELFSDIGKTVPSEGFAEFGQFLFGIGLSREQMREVMPNCLEVWEARGL